MEYHLIDIGANLLHPSFAPDRDEVIRRAREAGVTTIILTGASERGSREAADFAAARTPLDGPGTAFYATAGVHPHAAATFTDDTVGSLEELLRRPEVAAVGECGLDFNRDYSPRPVQERVFAEQVSLAARLGKPLFLHERDAHERFTGILRARRPDGLKAVVHCFTGTAAEVDDYLSLGLYIGITGWICDERRGLHLREAVRRVPLDRLMLETDAPFLVPRTLAGRPSRNEPAFLPAVLKTAAAALGRPEAEVAEATTRTAREFFGIGT